MLELECTIQDYAWGKVGSSSMVANLKASSGQGTFTINEEKTYAEFWMGTHPNGPSRVVVNDSTVPLLQWIQEHPNVLGSKLTDKGITDLPYLFKVLSVQKALSIQAHPDKDLAKKLHQEQPQIYKDPNHKPEMALALTPFEALCQFRPMDEILRHFDEILELRNLVSPEAINRFRNELSVPALKQLFGEYINSDKHRLEQQFSLLQQRLRNLKRDGQLTKLDDLVFRLCEQYPNDIGVFAPFLLNYIVLKPGEALYLGANEPHAYISGDCMECMACSDNVVRAGLTPKLIDKAVLCDMLTYRCGAPNILTGREIDRYSRLFTPPVEEFEIERVELPSMLSHVMKPSATGSILIVTSGDVEVSTAASGEKRCRTGTVLFCNAGVEVSVRTGNTPAVLFRAHANESA